MRRKKKNSGTVKQGKGRGIFYTGKGENVVLHVSGKFRGERGKSFWHLSFRALLSERERQKKRAEKQKCVCYREIYVVAFVASLCGGGRFAQNFPWSDFSRESTKKPLSTGEMGPFEAFPTLPCLLGPTVLCKFECAYSTSNSTWRESFTVYGLLQAPLPVETVNPDL